jgi:hypothetical protein
MGLRMASSGHPELSVFTAGDFHLRLVNGTDAASAATSGNVWINNTSVLSPNDFKRSDRIVLRRISLTPGANTLGVQLNGAPGSIVWILIEPSPSE